MLNIAYNRFWKTHALLLARVLMGGVFLMASIMKFNDIHGMAGYVASMHNWPFPVALIWLAAFFELVLGLCIVTGVFFREAALLLAVYAVFLAVAFHGPAMWIGSQDQFGFFIDHFVMLAGLLFMAGHGAGDTWKLGKYMPSLERLSHTA
jgi:putative oxidoreductase